MGLITWVHRTWFGLSRSEYAAEMNWRKWAKTYTNRKKK